MISPCVEIFKNLTSVPTAPYFEQSVIKKALAWIKENLGSRVKVKRHRGGIIARYQNGGPGPALALAGHLDHPAFHLSRVTAQGALAHLKGGLPPHLLPGCAVQAFTKNSADNVPLARGILERSSGEGLYPIRWTTPPPGREKIAFAILDLTPFSIQGPWLASRSIDDLLGCAMSLEALRCVVEAGVKTNLTVILHRAEEVGFMGALALIHEKAVDPGDCVLSIETSREMPGAEPGKGPVIRVGDKACLFDLNLTALLEESAKILLKKGVASQKLRLTGGSCEATAYLAFGYEASGLAIPLVNYHNGWGAETIAPEKVRLEDAAGAVKLLVEAAKLFPNHKPRASLRQWLEKSLKQNRKFL
ncbi:MAG: hypothetical protein HY921_11615 [Elusimicrobia bacterium]|nr:hypothetical protein [Elusimicrobiota bacterium]